MKPVRAILLTALFLTLLSGCTISTDQESLKGNREYKVVNRSVDQFNKISVRGDFEIELVNSDSNSIIVDADSNLHEYIYSEVANNQLVVSQPENRRLKSFRAIKVVINYTNLRAIEIIGKNTLTCSNTIHFDSLKLDAIGAAKIELDCNGKSALFGVCPGAVTLKLEGKVPYVEFDFPGAVHFNAENLITSTMKINMEGAGNAKVFVTDDLHVNIAGAGFVSYRGHPKNVYSNIGGIGKLVNDDE